MREVRAVQVLTGRVGLGAGTYAQGMATASSARAKVRSAEEIERRRGDLVDLSHRVHAEPELGFCEEKASGWVAEVLRDSGFDGQRGVCDMPTALSATYGNGTLRLGICAEYDALPDIGHACGHNVIAAAAVGAGLALAPLAEELDLSLSVLGTPAEEGGGGKVLMLERGVFDGLDGAMMVHPAPVEVVQMQTLAVAHLAMRFHGRESHASMFPEEAVNAGDALTISQVALGLLRQHLPAGDQVHGIVTHGGDAPNVIPGETEGVFLARSPTLARLSALVPRLRNCFEAGAVATGASLEVVELSPRYSEFLADAAMSELYVRNAVSLGRHFPEQTDLRPSGSTDMANVSLAIPAIHPMLGIDAGGAVNHQAAFTAACARPSADQAVLEGAIAMAWTAIDLATDPAQRAGLRTRAEALRAA